MCKMARFVNLCAGLLPVLNADGAYVQWCWKAASVQSRNGTTIDSVCVLKLAFEFQSWFQHTNWISVSCPELIGFEMEQVQILLYIHVNADGPTLPLWAGRRCSDSAWFKRCSSRRTLLYNAKAWASHAQQLTCWVVCCSKPPSWWERVRAAVS